MDKKQTDITKEKEVPKIKQLSKTISKLNFMKSSANADEEKQDESKNSEYWVNPKYNDLQTAQNKVIIEEKDPFLIKYRKHDTLGRKQYGQIDAIVPDEDIDRSESLGPNKTGLRYHTSKDVKKLQSDEFMEPRYERDPQKKSKKSDRERIHEDPSKHKHSEKRKDNDQSVDPPKKKKKLNNDY